MRFVGCLALALLGAAPASADAWVTLCAVDTQLGAVVDVNLAQAFATGGAIRFKCPSGTVLRVTKTYRLGTGASIDGASQITLDGNGLKGPMLDAGSNSLLLSRLTLRGFVAPRPTHVVEPGLIGAPALIATSGHLELDHVTIDDIPFSIVATGGVWAHDSSFSTASGYALTVRGEAVVDHDQFFGGSGVLLSAGKVHGSSFSRMTGPAINVELPTGPVEIRASTFTGGQASAIQATQRARAAQTLTVTVRDNTFSGNVGASGGAIALVGIPPGVLHGDPLTQTQPIRLVTAYNRFRNNQAQSGGAVDADLTNTAGWESTGDLFLGNASSGSGGAIIISGGSASITHALFADNRAAGSGGAISVPEQSAVIVANALAVRNAAATGVFAGDALTFTNATIAANAAVGLVGGPGTRVTNTILAGNRPSDCSGLSTGMFVGPNMQSDSSCPGVPSGDAYLDPMFVPAPGSPVRTAGDLKACIAAPVSASDILFQERGLGGFCALGAFEAVPVRSLGQAAAGPAPHGDPSDDFPDADASSAGSGGSGSPAGGGQGGVSAGGGGSGGPSTPSGGGSPGSGSLSNSYPGNTPGSSY